jgi:PTS system ascorbate-specific IIC component
MTVMPYWLKMFVDILSTPAIIIGLVALIGLVVQRKEWPDIILGTLRSMLGLLIVSGGAGVLIGGVAPIGALWREAFGISGYYGLAETITAAILPTIGTEVGMTMALGFLFHCVLVRLLPFEQTKQIYLTGHVMWTMAGCAAIALYGYQLTGTTAIIFGTVFQGVYLTVANAMAWVWVKKVTNGEFGFGHTQSSIVFFMGWLSKLGDPKQNAEELELPGWLRIFKQPAIIGIIIMLFSFLVPVLMIGPAGIEANYSGGKNFLVWAFMGAANFGAGVQIIMLGVRMFIAEIIPAFKGISEKIIPGAKAGLDCPAIYPYSPIGAMLGVASYTIGEFIGIGLQAMLTPNYVWVPSAVGIYFVGSTMGVIGNIHGGVRGAVICGLVAPIFGRTVSMWATQTLSIIPVALGPGGLDLMSQNILLQGGDQAWNIIYSLVLQLLGYQPVSTLAPPPLFGT